MPIAIVPYPAGIPLNVMLLNFQLPADCKCKQFKLPEVGGESGLNSS